MAFSPRFSLLSEDGPIVRPAIAAVSAPATAAPSLADQLRKQWSGDWNIQGIDRAQELADMLQAKGVTSLDGLSMARSDYLTPEMIQQMLTPDGDGRQIATTEDEARALAPAGYKLSIGGKIIAPWSDGNSGDTVARLDGEFGNSMAGHGAVGYIAVQTPNGVQIMPRWASSNDASEVRQDALAAAAMVGAGYGMQGLFGALQGGAAAAGSGLEGLASNAGWSPAADSMAANSALGISGDSAAAAAVAPSGVNMGSLGGVMSTGGMASYPVPDPVINAQPLPEGITAPPIEAPTVNVPQAPAFNVAPDVPQAAFRSSVDSQLANTQLGYGGGDIAAIAPKTVNMGSLGGTTATTGGIRGLLDTGAQKIADATASDQIGGTPLSQAGQATSGLLQSGTGAAGDVASWLKSNPTLGRLLFSGAISALSGASQGGSSTPAASGPVGPAVQWKSPLQTGLLTQPTAKPQAMNYGLLGTGQANDGAWRWLKG